MGGSALFVAVVRDDVHTVTTLLTHKADGADVNIAGKVP